MKLEWIKKKFSQNDSDCGNLNPHLQSKATHNLLVTQYFWLSQSVSPKSELMIGLGVAMPDWELSNIQAIITSSSLISIQNSLLWWSVWFLWALPWELKVKP